MPNLPAALDAFLKCLDSQYVITSPDALTSASTATFATHEQVSAIVQPSNREEVQACVKIANEYAIPLYPVSKGKNWGYGSRVPTTDGCVILALDRLNRIFDYDEQLAYVTVEPGVTFQQLNEFLMKKNSNLMVNAPGSTSEASVVGNTVERGVVQGMHGDRCDQVCGLGVVLATGDYIRTGMDRFDHASAAKVHKWGVGPSVDGLFLQSNLGIITHMTVWLTPMPKYFQQLYFTLEDASHFDAVIDAFQSLRMQQVIGTSCSLFNDYRVLWMQGQYPYVQTESLTPLPDKVKKELLVSNREANWFGEAAICSETLESVMAKQQVMTDRLGAMVKDLTFTAVNSHNPFFSRSVGTGLGSAYWRKKTPPPIDMDPDRDQCGVIWCSPVVAFTGSAVSRCVDIIHDTLLAHAFEPGISIQGITERCAYVVASITYDREEPGQDEAASACYEALVGQLSQAGCIPYRLGIQGMNNLPDSQGEYGRLLMTLKRALDPHDILAPGRYDFRNEWPPSP